MQSVGEDRVLFVNGIWRSSTTYVWNKVRNDREWRCYYEPLHESLSVYSPAMNEEVQRKKVWEQMRHPELRNAYFEEFPLAGSGVGVPLFQDKFCYERFFLGAGDSYPELEEYFRSLVRHARSSGQRTCLQPNRMFLRSQWFQSVFPTFHVWVSRDWWDIWRSMGTYPNRYFPSRFYLISALNAGHPVLAPLLAGKGLPVPETLAYTGEEPTLEPWFAEPLEPFRYFYYYYVCASILNASGADTVIDVSAGAEGEAHRAAAAAHISAAGAPVSFGDLRTPSYPRGGDYSHLAATAKEIEELIRLHLPSLRIPAAKIPPDLPAASSLRQLLERFEGPAAFSI